LTKNKISNIKIINIAGYNGNKTQNHDQFITLHNFSVMNTIVRSPTNPIPFDDEFSLIFIFNYNLFLPVHLLLELKFHNGF